MRNLKRALSLVVASVMLLGMMVMGTSAASTTFTDNRQIVNSEAAAITGGLGIFSGYADGSFGAKNIVTRAEMATIVVKMLYGADYNADPFKGTGKFSDVADYQGGWAEGYVNICASLGIIAGYSDGTFKPGNTLTTAEAITFIINALGIDAGKGDWPVTVMSKGAELGLFGDLVPKTDAGMTRDDLSVLVYEGLKYSPNAGQKWTLDGIEFDSMNDALIYKAITQSANNPVPVDDIKGSLAEKVFNLDSELILITGNAATEVQYKGDAVKTTEGKVWSTIQDTDNSVADIEYEYYIDTPKEMVGHVATVYWQDKNGNGTYEKATEKVYTIMQESKAVVLAADLKGQTAAQVQAALGLKNAPTVANTKTPFYFWSYNDITGTTYENRLYNTSSASHKDVFTANNGKLDVIKGTYTIYDGQLVSYYASAGRVVAYYLHNPTKGDGKFTLTDENDYCLVTEYAAGKTSPVKVAANNNGTPDDTSDDTPAVYYGPIVANYDGTDTYKCISNLDSLELDQKDSGYYVYITNYVGEFRSLAAVTTIQGTMTKFEIGSANHKIWIDGTQYNLQPANYDDDILTALTVQAGKEAQHLSGLGTGTDANNKDNAAYLFGVGRGDSSKYQTKYEFIAAGSYVFAYRPIASAAPTKTMVVPVYKYTKTGAEGEYGQAGTDTYWVQAVDMTGKEVNLQVTSTEYATLEAYTGDDANTANITEVAGQIKVKDFYTYTTSYNSSLKATVADFTNVSTGKGTVAANATELSKSVADTAQTPNSYYFTEGFKVLYITGTGATLKVAVKDGSYKTLTQNALIYGEKAKSTDSWYNVKYQIVAGAYSAGPEAGEEILFMPSIANMNYTTNYKDAAGATHPGYRQTVYVDGIKDEVVTTWSEYVSLFNLKKNESFKGGFYTYTKDTVTGTYDLTEFDPTNTKYTVIKNERVTRNVNGLISTSSQADMDATEVDVVSVVVLGTYANNMSGKEITDISKLTNKYSISALYNNETGKIDLLYVTYYTA